LVERKLPKLEVAGSTPVVRFSVPQSQKGPPEMKAGAPMAGPVAELLGFTMSPKGLRVRLRERSSAVA
jgi:hypothetical protein